MKLKNGLIGGILVVGAMIHLSFTSAGSNNSGVCLSNIEALSSGEIIEYCDGVGSVDCPISSIKVQRILSL